MNKSITRTAQNDDFKRLWPNHNQHALSSTDKSQKITENKLIKN